MKELSGKVKRFFCGRVQFIRVFSSHGPYHYVRHHFKPIRLENCGCKRQSTISHERCFPAKTLSGRHCVTAPLPFPPNSECVRKKDNVILHSPTRRIEDKKSLSFSFSPNINKSNSLQSSPLPQSSNFGYTRSKAYFT